jgi:Tfp pilus assembly protein PilO
VSRRAPLFVGLAAAAALILAVALLVVPMVSRLGERRDELARERERTESLQTQLEQLEEVRERAEMLQLELDRLRSAIPPTADLPSLLRLLENTATQSAVDFMSFTPGDPALAPTGNFSIIPAQITITGGFFSVDQFLFQLESLPRAVRISEIVVGPGPVGLPQLHVAMEAEVYTTDTSTGPGSVPGPTVTEPAESNTPGPSDGG